MAFRLQKCSPWQSLRAKLPTHSKTHIPFLRFLCRRASQRSLGSAAASTRKQVTVTSDDGRVEWKDLTKLEKAARTTQQTFNSGIILVGILMTGGVVFLLYTDVFSPDSKTSHFNRAVDRIRADHRAQELLGPSKEIRAYGESTWSKWARVRPIASKVQKDAAGREHLIMHFNVEGSRNRGVVNLHMTKAPGQSQFIYQYLALDVKGHPRVFLESTEVAPETKQAPMKMFGVKWW